MHIVYTNAMSRLQRQNIWRELVTDWRQSGHKSKVFCQSQGLRLADLRRWDYRLKKIGTIKKATLTNKSSTSSVSTFIPVTLTNENPNQNVLMTLQHCNGFSLQFSADSDEKLLRKLLRLVAEVQC